MAQNVGRNVKISNQIETDTGFYYQRLSEFPAKLATIEYTITFNKTNIELLCVNGTRCILRLDIYTSEDDQNLMTNCSSNGFGQLRNENLNTPLRNWGKPYRFTTCKLDNVDSDLLHCKGRTIIQDVVPRNYGFSIRYHCKAALRPSLCGLFFNFTISEQTNKTTCTKVPKHDEGIFKCHEFYTYTSLPNFIGDLAIQNVQLWMDSNAASALLSLIFSSDRHFCYKYFRELVCHIAYPECDPVKECIVHICRKTCDDFLEACLKSTLSILHKLSSSGFPFTWRWREPINVRDEVDCDYLPSHGGPHPCYYKPVTCDPPPNATNARIINGYEVNGTHLAMSQVEYECLDETLQMEGNSTMTCLHSGLWSETPRCLSVPASSSTNPLLFVMPILIIPLFLWIMLSLVIWSRKDKGRHAHTRNKKYDAFLCYDIADADYAHGINY